MLPTHATYIHDMIHEILKLKGTEIKDVDYSERIRVWNRRQ